MITSAQKFPAVPFHLGLYPVVDTVEWIARLLEAGVKTLQLRVKDYLMLRPNPPLLKLLRWGETIRRGCSSTITGVWR